MKRAMALLLTIVIACFTAVSFADGYFIICNPGSWVNVRRGANKATQLLGRVECGEYLETDGKKKNGYYHVTGLPFEEDEGWVYKGYLVPDKPVIETFEAYICSRGKVRCRRSVNGARQGMLKNGSTFTVYAHSEEWAVTSRGFIQTQYIEEWGGVAD